MLYCLRDGDQKPADCGSFPGGEEQGTNWSIGRGENLLNCIDKYRRFARGGGHGKISDGAYFALNA